MSNVSVHLHVLVQVRKEKDMLSLLEQRPSIRPLILDVTNATGNRLALMASIARCHAFIAINVASVQTSSCRHARRAGSDIYPPFRCGVVLKWENKCDCAHLHVECNVRVCVMMTQAW